VTEPQAGRELRVRVVLTGRVSHPVMRWLSASNYIDTTHESQLWSGEYRAVLHALLGEVILASATCSVVLEFCFRLGYATIPGSPVPYN
jgi:TolB-like protein